MPWGVLTAVAFFVADGTHYNPYLERGIKQVQDLDERTALRTLEQARSWTGTTPAELARVHLWIGLAFAGLRQPAKAKENFKAALVLEPKLELPEDASPLVQAWWREAGGTEGSAREPAAMAPPAPGPPAPPVIAPPPAAVAPQAPAPSLPPPTAPASLAELGIGANALFRTGHVDPEALVTFRYGDEWGLQVELGVDWSQGTSIALVEGQAAAGPAWRSTFSRHLKLGVALEAGGTLSAYSVSIPSAVHASGSMLSPGVWLPLRLSVSPSPRWEVGLRFAGAWVRGVEHTDGTAVLWQSGTWRVETGLWAGWSF
jgi:hypothetical protein